MEARCRRLVERVEAKESRVELPADQIVRIDTLEQQIAIMARALLALEAKAMTPLGLIEAADEIKRQRNKC